MKLRTDARGGIAIIRALHAPTTFRLVFGGTSTATGSASLARRAR